MLFSNIKKHIIPAGAFLIFFVLCFLSPTVARAELVPLDHIPLDGTWATGCDIYSAGQNIRVSKPPTRATDGYLDFRNQTITATAGQTVNLEIVIYTTSCRPADTYYPLGTGNYIGNIQIDGGATVTPSLAGAIAVIGYNSNVLSIETYRIAISVTIPANLPTGTKTFTVGLNGGEKINLFKNGVYQCVLSGGNRSGYDNPLHYYGCAPGPASLSFNVNVQAAIQQTYLGTVQTNKRLASDSSLTSDPTVSGANITLSHSGQGCNSWSESSTAQSWQKPLWVNPCSSTVSTQGDYNNSIDVPTGYKLNRVQLSGGDTDLVSTVCTDNTNKTGTCVAYGVRVVNGTYTFVDWFLEKIPPTLTVICTPDNGATGGKITVTASSNIPGDTNPATIKDSIDAPNPPTATRTLNTSPESFDILSKYRDGNDHTYYATYAGLSKSITFGPNQPNCKIDKWFYPWLQTSQGDVVADGKIEGQTTSTGTAGTLGARLDSDVAKEAEFLVISAVGGDGPFCSTYKYILTNTSSQGTNCGNGLGYNFNSTGIDNDTVDRVIGGVKQAFADNGNNATSTPSACSANGIATATVTQTPAVMSTTCTGGIIYKQSSNTLPPLMNLNKGKVTIFVDGNLTITGPIFYTVRTDLYPVADPRLVPTLAIVVTGDVDITSNTTQIDAQIYSKGTIRTCSKNSINTAAATPQDCSINRLLVNGSLSAKAGFDFRRTFISEASRTSAEFIKLTGNSIVIPPPGIDSRYFYNNFSSYKLDSAEYNPRF